MYRSATIHALDLHLLNHVAYFIALSLFESEVPEAIEVKDSERYGSIVKSCQHLRDAKYHLRELRKCFKMDFRSTNHPRKAEVSFFVPTRKKALADNSSNWNGIKFTMSYTRTNSVKFVTIDCVDSSTSENPFKHNR
jgi:hypothetical protein